MFNTAPPIFPMLGVIGDSIIARMSTNVPANLPNLGAPFSQAINYGEGSDTTVDILARIGTVSASVKTLYIEGGVNNFVAVPALDTSIVPNYQSILNALPSGMSAFIVGIFHVNLALLAVNFPQYVGLITNTKIDTYNALLRNGLSSPRLAGFVDYTNFFPQTIDGIHFTDADYYAMSARINQPYFR